MIRIKKGLDVPIAGAPEQTIRAAPAVRRVALLGDDYVGLKPTMLVREGDTVQLGQPLFQDKKAPRIQFTSPGSGRVVAVNRGAKRKFESIVVELEGDDEVTFPTIEAGAIATADGDSVRETLLTSGLWTALRTRPYSKVPDPDSVPHAIFVTAIDTRPLCADPAPIIKEREPDFAAGLKVLGRLTEGAIHVCTRPGLSVPTADAPRVRVDEFSGPHPAGLPGTHIHFLDPVDENKTVWHIGYQDVLAIGRLFTTGRIFPERVIALAGPVVERPGLLRTRTGANVEEVAAGSISADGVPGEGIRLISGSVLDGHTAEGPHAYLGRYDLQVSAIGDTVDRPFLGWLGAGTDKFSVTRTFAAALSGAGRMFRFNTATHGDPRPIIPIGVYEKVLPLDFEPAALLKAIAIRDAEGAQALGALELAPEDLALCSFVDPGKSSFGESLKRVLAAIEREG
jgi:Na+-transporting NADH:ubiquinone oxidoreductase subunit A